MVKPLLKWVGGKQKLINKILPKFPKKINNYYEIFVGGGSILLALLSNIKNGNIDLWGNIFAYDANEILIHVYINIQIQPDKLWLCLQDIIGDFNKTDESEKEKYYYWIRSKYNEWVIVQKHAQTILASALFIFLNKTCFRGLYRIGPNGFNVPYGHYKNPKFIKREHFDEFHKLIQGVVFKCSDYKKALENNQYITNDFIYLDPPYVSEYTGSFVNYTVDGFGMSDHLYLFGLLHKFTQCQIKFILSNADVQLIRDHFKPNWYTLFSIKTKRTINSKNPAMEKTEVIITNFEVDPV